MRRNFILKVGEETPRLWLLVIGISIRGFIVLPRKAGTYTNDIVHTVVCLLFFPKFRYNPERKAGRIVSRWFWCFWWWWWRRWWWWLILFNMSFFICHEHILAVIFKTNRLSFFPADAWVLPLANFAYDLLPPPPHTHTHTSRNGTVVLLIWSISNNLSHS